jgi:hypothetical protein
MNPVALLCKVRVIKLLLRSEISGFRRNVDDICTLLGYYSALSGNLTGWRENAVAFITVRYTMGTSYLYFFFSEDEIRSDLFMWRPKWELVDVVTTRRPV